VSKLRARYADNCGGAPFRVRDGNGVVWCPRIEDKVSWVIRIVLRYGIWKPAAWVIISIKYVFDAVSGLGPSQTCPEDLTTRESVVNAMDSHTRKK